MIKQLLFLFSCLTFSVSVFAQNNTGSKNGVPPKIDSVVTVSAVDTIPNCFSPNNDGINDVFEIGGSGLTDFTLSIYNRWGTKVYDFISPGDAWDGYSTTGEPCSNGTYFYFLVANGVDGKSYKSKGTIQLFR